MNQDALKVEAKSLEVAKLLQQKQAMLVEIAKIDVDISELLGVNSSSNVNREIANMISSKDGCDRQDLKFDYMAKYPMQRKDTVKRRFNRSLSTLLELGDVYVDDEGNLRAG